MPNSAPVTDADLIRAAESLAEVEHLWLRLDALSPEATMTCYECGGTGTLAGGGIFGEVPCPTCDGQRTIPHPAADEMKQLAAPDFKGMRTKLHELSSAHDKALQEAYVRGEAAGPSPITREALQALEAEIAAVREQGRDRAVKQIAAAPAPGRGSLSIGTGVPGNEDEP